MSKQGPPIDRETYAEIVDAAIEDMQNSDEGIVGSSEELETEAPPTRERPSFSFKSNRVLLTLLVLVIANGLFYISGPLQGTKAIDPEAADLELRYAYGQEYNDIKAFQNFLEEGASPSNPVEFKKTVSSLNSQLSKEEQRYSPDGFTVTKDGTLLYID